MHFVIAYVTVTNGEKTSYFAQRFADTFRQFTPGVNFELYVLCNGGPPPESYKQIFRELNPKFLPRENVGGDIGAYIDLAKVIDGEKPMLCLGESVHFWKSGWLRRLVEARFMCGRGLYGFYSSNLVVKHLNTTAFAVEPELLRQWPEVVKTREQRLLIEHGPLPLWRRIEAQGKPVRLVHWDSIVEPHHWRRPPIPNEFWRGNQSQCLMFCNHTERYTNANQATKKRWETNADFGIK